MTAQFKNAVISSVLKDQMCYIHCASSKPAKPDHSNFSTADGKFCEAKCWQNWSDEKELKLFSLDVLIEKRNQWNIELLEYLKASFDHYKKHGYEGDSINPSVEELYEGRITSTSESFLPVCDSYLPPQKDVGTRESMPCQCGNINGKDTAAF